MAFWICSFKTIFLFTWSQIIVCYSWPLCLMWRGLFFVCLFHVFYCIFSTLLLFKTIGRVLNAAIKNAKNFWLIISRPRKYITKVSCQNATLLSINLIFWRGKIIVVFQFYWHFSDMLRRLGCLVVVVGKSLEIARKKLLFSKVTKPCHAMTFIYSRAL